MNKVEKRTAKPAVASWQPEENCRKQDRLENRCLGRMPCNGILRKDAFQRVKLDYLKVVNPRTFQPVDDDYRGPARVLIAAQVGTTRLIDNEAIYLN